MMAPAPSPVWTALADPTRRRILDLLRERPRTTGELAERFPTTRFAVMKHLAVLEKARLVLVRRSGRERWNHLNAVPLQRVYGRWVKPHEAVWAAKLTGLKSRLEGANMPTETVTSTIEQVELEIEIAAPPVRVWKAPTEDTTFWWPRDFYTNPKAKGFHIEPKLGGRM
jgi:DNA-binding transcriptional ArsR family regulator